jgi:hypothetical protein
LIWSPATAAGRKFSKSRPDKRQRFDHARQGDEDQGVLVAGETKIIFALLEIPFAMIEKR